MTEERTTYGIIGGYGAAGQVVTSELLRSTSAGILVGGRDAGKAEAFASNAGERILAQRVDIFEGASLEEFCGRCEVVVNCAGPGVEVADKVAQAALRQGCHYVDPGGYSLVLELMKTSQAEVEKRGLSFVVSAGWIPGLSEVFVAYANRLASQSLDEVERIDLYFGDRNEWSTTGVRDLVWHAINYSFEAVGFYRRGQWVKASIFKGMAMAELPAPLGKQRAFLHFNDELRRFAQDQRECDVVSHLAFMSLPTIATMTFVRLFLKKREDLAVQVITKAFRRDYQRQGKGGFLLVRAQGREGEKRRSLTAQLFENRHYWITGVVPATVARMIVAGKMKKPGCHFLGDAVDPLEFMEELRKVGVRFTSNFGEAA